MTAVVMVMTTVARLRPKEQDRRSRSDGRRLFHNPDLSPLEALEMPESGSETVGRRYDRNIRNLGGVRLGFAVSQGPQMRGTQGHPSSVARFTSLGPGPLSGNVCRLVTNEGLSQAAEKLRFLRRNREKRPSAAEAALILLALCGG
jgi:hypothetical protein